MASSDLLDLLACAALEPALGGMLFIDLDGRKLVACAEALAAGIEEVEGRRQRIVTVGSWTSEEELWPHWGVGLERGEPVLGLRPGLLSERPDKPVPLVVVPDLARASRAVTRAAVSVLGADVVHVERDHVRDRWPPTARWLAACARCDVPALSPHLLDRFPVRWDGARAGYPPESMGEAIRQHLRQVVDRGPGRRRPESPDEAADLLLRAEAGLTSIRRTLALGRAARAMAERRGSPAVMREDVVRAGGLLSMAPSTFLDTPVPDEEPVPDPRSATPAEPVEELTSLTMGAVTDSVNMAGSGSGFAELSSPEAVAEEHASLGHAESLYPEDDPEAVPEARSLQWSTAGLLPTGRAMGTVTGHESTRALRDLAVIPTLFRAVWRCRAANHTTGRLLIAAEDLRRYRREEGARRLLVLVIDHTCRRDWDCSPGLASHLRWAYEHSAAVSVIEFGHRGSVDELRPERYRARSVVDPRVVTSFSRRPGSASPLAAAIDLAAEELRRFMHRGWAAVRVARLVVVTDGRGNVPLDATAEGRVIGRITREGVDDAVSAAQGIANLRRVEANVVAPVTDQYRNLLDELALALGGTITFVRDEPDVP
jgi:magnesium chelatase subunit D